VRDEGFRDGRAGIDAALVKRLVAGQFPQWSELPVRPVELDGWDNRTYRLGDQLTVRLPTANGYVPAVEKENRWLPVLAPHLPVPIPVPVASGQPAEGYPFPWSIRRWLDGEPATRTGASPSLASSVAEFILALQRVDATGGPAAGAHSFFRGCSPAHYDDETRAAIAAHAEVVDTRGAEAVWDAALESAYHGRPIWFHGDIASGNLLVQNEELAAVIDFGTSGVGDPACDLVVSWTLFSNDSRRTFRTAVGQDEQTWARARGWALWKALISLPPDVGTTRHQGFTDLRVISEVINDHQLAGRNAG
jgi:aminoglycoside phosphotransferase (APT) family kinase protein